MKGVRARANSESGAGLPTRRGPLPRSQQIPWRTRPQPAGTRGSH